MAEPSGATTTRLSRPSGKWLKKNRSLETAASTVIHSALESTVVDGSSHTLWAWAEKAPHSRAMQVAIRVLSCMESLRVFVKGFRA